METGKVLVVSSRPLAPALAFLRLWMVFHGVGQWERSHLRETGKKSDNCRVKDAFLCGP